MKIPDDVFKNRCQWCIFYEGRENIDVPGNRIFSNWCSQNAPCRIFGICACNKVPGECLSFQPREMFGICRYCRYDNCFRKDSGFCTHPHGPINKRMVFLTDQRDRDGYWSQHSCYTCDRYSVEPTWKDHILDNVKRGRAPQNFDPYTWEATAKVEGSSAEVLWASILKEEQQKRDAAATQAREAIEENGDQLSLF